ncbi:hypothetical protein B5807_07653 [Epicoccum nigrum]|uniref:Uncharacterized protein n=1 Tax=Epicoccum nigrum TaxID=105696 RepID=A0A1Y2LXK1_EPING|nr:hypothetical protein B5807_07653 [Epicoccum nigrum]
MGWAPFGDLTEIFRVMGGTSQVPHKQLPEPYVWFIFKALVEEAKLLKRPTIEKFTFEE